LSAAGRGARHWKNKPMGSSPIQTDADYRAAVDEIRALWDAEAGSADEDRLDVLATLVDAYERQHWPASPTPKQD
jgi:antitoxin component HigA of HigAB toxin-antitoxin module